MIYFECPECAEELSAPSSLAGEVLQCPVCAAQATVPSPDSAPSGQKRPLKDIDDDLYHATPEVRGRAVQALADHVGDSAEAVHMLIRKFRDRDRNVRDAVMRVLLAMNRPELAGMVVRELGAHWSSDVLLREAVFDLIKFGPAAAGSLIDILDETVHYPRRYDPAAVRASVMLLAEWNQDQAIPLLAKMFRRHFDLHVRDEAAYSLAMVGKPEQWKEIKALPKDQKRVQGRNLAKAVMAERNIRA